jgi:hypothetical protein
MLRCIRDAAAGGPRQDGLTHAPATVRLPLQPGVGTTSSRMSRDPAKRRASKQRYNQSAGQASKQRREDKLAPGRAERTEWGLEKEQQ